jgi:hypothetical protein
MRKQPRKSVQDLKTTSNTQDVAEMLSEAVFKAKNDILNEVLKSLQRRGNAFIRGVWSSCKSLETGAVNHKKVTGKIQVNYKRA